MHKSMQSRQGWAPQAQTSPPGSRPTLPAENGCSCGLARAEPAIASILTAANEAMEIWRVRSRSLHARQAALTLHASLHCAASPATSGPWVERISPHTLARPSRAPDHCSLASASAIPHCVPQQSEPDQPGSLFILLSKDSHRGSRRGGRRAETGRAGGPWRPATRPAGPAL